MSVEQKKVVKLTPKQEKFCRCIVSGMSAKDSYLTAYDTNCNDRVAINEGSKLMLRDDIRQAIENMTKPLQEIAQQTALTEREKIKSILWNRLQKAIEREDDATIVKYTDQINRMNAEYVNVNRNIDEKTAEIDQLDADTLRRLVETQ